MKTIKIGLTILLISTGVFMVVFGERDDSPGAQGLGVIMAVAGVVIIARSTVWRPLGKSK